MSVDQVTLYRCPRTQETVFTGEVEARSRRKKTRKSTALARLAFSMLMAGERSR